MYIYMIIFCERYHCFATFIGASLSRLLIVDELGVDFDQYSATSTGLYVLRWFPNLFLHSSCEFLTYFLFTSYVWIIHYANQTLAMLLRVHNSRCLIIRFLPIFDTTKKIYLYEITVEFDIEKCCRYLRNNQKHRANQIWNIDHVSCQPAIIPHISGRHHRDPMQSHRIAHVTIYISL